MGPMVLTIGLFGNLSALLVLERKRFKKIGSVNIYKLLFYIDIFYLVQLLQPYLAYAYAYDLTLLSDISCKLYYFINTSMATLSPNCLIYISIEKLTSIRYLIRKEFFKKKLTQFLFFIIVIAFNVICYTAVPFLIGINEQFVQNGTNQSRLICYFNDSSSQFTVSLIILINRVIMSSVVMIALTISLASTVFKSRYRVVVNYTSRQNELFQRDIKFSLTAILLNLIYLFLNLPIGIALFIPGFLTDYIQFLVMFYLFYSSYACNFYLILMSNSIFRREFSISARNLINTSYNF